MGDRIHDRIPFRVRVQFRNSSSFLIAYSLNLSRGGIFLATTESLAIGAALTLDFEVPNVGKVVLNGRVTWRRPPGNDDEPGGIGVEFDDVGDQLSEVIDRLVSEFAGITVLLLSPEPRERGALTRMLRSIVGTADIVTADNAALAIRLLEEPIDLVVLDGDEDTAGGVAVCRAALALAPAVPVVALCDDAGHIQLLRAAGAAEIAANPPPFAVLQRAVVRALGRPALISAG